MNADRLLAQFERISDAPDAIPRMRRFILDLAVRGKLVEQDPEDEPAEELLNCIMRLKNGEPLATSDESPLPFHLPTGWVSTTLRSLVVSSNSGWSPKTLDTPREGDEWGILKVSAVSWDHFRSAANKQVLPGTQPRPQAVLRKGDFLISRANTAELVARAVIVEIEPINLMMSDKIVRLELVELCEPKFILMTNNHWSFARAYYAERATGVSPSMKNVTRDVILDLPIPLPPLAEQHRIVAKVDELMALCAQLEAARQQRDQGRERLIAATLQRLSQPAEDPATFRKDASFALQVLPSLTTSPAQIKQLRQTILNLAVRGKLVEQDPEDEPAEELLARIEADRKLLSSTKGHKHYKSIQSLPTETQPCIVPASWAWVHFGDIMYSRDGERIPVSKDERSRREKIYDYYGASGVIDRIDGYLFDKPLLLVGEDGANLLNRSTPIAFIARGKYWVNNHAHVLDGISEEFLRFIELSINATDLAPYVTGTAQPKMNQAKMNSIPIALPPLAEQHRIVAKVDELMALCDQLEQQVSQADQQRRRLLEALLAEALVARLSAEEESHAHIA